MAALVTIAVGLVIHRGVVPLPTTARDVAGDALWAAMIYWWLSAVQPAAWWMRRVTLAIAVCWTVEGSQLVHTASLDAFRATTIGHLILGSGFDPRDLLAYVIGVALAALLDVTLLNGGRADSGR